MRAPSEAPAAILLAVAAAGVEHDWLQEIDRTQADRVNKTVIRRSYLHPFSVTFKDGNDCTPASLGNREERLSDLISSEPH